MRTENIPNGIRLVFDSLKEEAEFKIDQLNHYINVKRSECLCWGEGEKERTLKELEYWQKIANSAIR